MKILVTGGCGYIGTNLVNSLLFEGHTVSVIDTQWFGNKLLKHKRLKIIKSDIRKLDFKYFKNITTVIHLANIANDPSVELNQNLSWQVNVEASKYICDAAVKAGVKQIIFGSSGSVYGIKKERKVIEEMDLVPISIYNKTKMIAERIFMSYQNDLKVHIIRPATVCGYSDRMRLDLTVNLLTFQALSNKLMTVFGGNQIRPNIHINDMVRVYMHFINRPSIKSGSFNAGFENLKIIEIAEKIQSKIKAEIKILKSNDVRSYRLDSTKLINTNFNPEYNVDHAIDQLVDAYKSKKLKNNQSCYTVSWMQKNKIK
jgi:nucleoside-diphosphate-sugar epimerase